MISVRKHIRNSQDNTPMGRRLCDLLVDDGEPFLEFKTGKDRIDRISLKVFLAQVNAALNVTH